jgi:redox-sensing transcriptional repressor
VQRLPLYLQILDHLPPETEGVSSDEMARRAGFTAAKVRRDLSYLGSHGIRGVGYEVEHLRFQIRLVLGLDRQWHVLIVGAGNIGRALAKFPGFGDEGFSVVGLVDDDHEVIGTVVAGLKVEPPERLGAIVAERRVDIGVIAVPASGAQLVATELATAGVKSILNFAPAVLEVPDDIKVRHVSLSNELQVLSYYLHQSRP